MIWGAAPAANGFWDSISAKMRVSFRFSWPSPRTFQKSEKWVGHVSPSSCLLRWRRLCAHSIHAVYHVCIGILVHGDQSAERQPMQATSLRLNQRQSLSLPIRHIRFAAMALTTAINSTSIIICFMLFSQCKFQSYIFSMM